jgi:glucose-6-phosphate dehydrogenase assembly protein OpcA
VDFTPGDTDLAWTQLTSWRAVLASAYDAVDDVPVSARIDGDPSNPATLLLSGWLSTRLGFIVPINACDVEIRQVSFELADGTSIRAVREGRNVLLYRQGNAVAIAPFHDRSLGELLTEELRRLDHDQIYEQALRAAWGAAMSRSDPGSAHVSGAKPVEAG